LCRGAAVLYGGSVAPAHPRREEGGLIGCLPFYKGQPCWSD
jgi:hypothetical protein